MKQRSAAYPSYTILDSLGFSERIYKNYGTNYRATREEIADALNYSVGSMTQKVSAAVQYGLLDMKSKEGYQVTDLFVKWYRPISEESKNQALVEAFKNPSLYIDLIDVFEGHVLPPVKPLASILLQKHSISEKACDKAAEIFEENANIISALSKERVLSFETKEDIENIIEYEQEEIEYKVVENSSESLPPSEYKRNDQSGNKGGDKTGGDGNHHGNNPIPHNIPLKNKMPAQLLLPSDVSGADFDFIISYIGLIRNQY